MKRRRCLTSLSAAFWDVCFSCICTLINTWNQEKKFSQLRNSATFFKFTGILMYCANQLKLQIPHAERSATRGRAGQETGGGFLWYGKLLPKMIIKTWSELAKPQSNISTLGTAPPAPQLAEALFPHSDSKISPVGTQNLSCASCAEPTSTYMSPCPGTIFVHDCTDMEFWKKIIWNHLKMATHCHFSYQKLFSIRMAMIQYLKSSNWAQKRNLTETSGFDSAFCKTWRDMQFFFLFPKQKVVHNSI